MLRSGPEMHLPRDSPGTCPALPCRAAHPLLPALTSLRGQEEQRLAPGDKRKSIFSYPLGEREWGGREGAGAVRLQGESSLPAESEKMHLGPFPPSGMASQLLGLGGVSRDQACGKQEGLSSREAGELGISPGPTEGQVLGREVGPSLPPGPPWVAPASAPSSPVWSLPLFPPAGARNQLETVDMACWCDRTVLGHWGTLVEGVKPDFTNGDLI